MFLHQFLAGILCDISKPIRAASEVKTLDQATKWARLLMAVDNDGLPPVTVTGDSTARGHAMPCYQDQLCSVTVAIAHVQ